MVSTQADINWKLSQLRHARWEDNSDPMEESAITFAVSLTLQALLKELTPILLEWCPQDIRQLKIVDKTYGELTLQWFGPVLELDLDISADGQVSFLLCRTGSPRDSWLAADNTSVDEFIAAVNTLRALDETL